MWYTHLRNLLKDHYGQTIETVREAVVGLEVPTSPSPRRGRQSDRSEAGSASSSRCPPRGRHAKRGSGESPASLSGTPTTRRHRSHSTSSSSSSDTPRPAPQIRNETVREPTSPSPRGCQSDRSEAGLASSSCCPPRGRHAKRGSDEPSASSPRTPTPRRHRSHSTSSPSSSDTPRPAPQTRKRAREPTPEPGKPECPKVPFPEPPPRVRPSEYLRRRCPACFANLKRDDSQL
jgi:hypothetical protein